MLKEKAGILGKNIKSSHKKESWPIRPNSGKHECKKQEPQTWLNKIVL